MSEALATALADRDGRARRRGRTRDLAAWWVTRPPLAALRARLDAIGGDDATAALDAARPLLADIGWIEEGIAALVGEMAADPLFEPPLRALSHETQAGLQLFDHARLAITLTIMPIDLIAAHKSTESGPRSIGFGGRRSLMRVVRSGGAILDTWSAPPADASFSAGDAPPCAPAGRIALDDGAILAFDGSRTAWAVGEARGDVVLLQATARAATAPVMLEYDAATRAFVGATATDGATMRMQMLAGLLRRMGRRDAAPAIAAAAGEGPFYLRWQLVRDLAALDATAAMPLLRTMAADDAHDEVRAAATRTLALLAA